MFELFPEMNDKPDSQAVGGSLAYILAMFLILPFFLTVFGVLLFPTEEAQVWLEVVFHLVSFGLCVVVFREYLADCFLTLKRNVGRFVLVTILGTVACCGVWLCFCLFVPYEPYGVYGVFYSLPVSEKNLLLYPLDVLWNNPIPGLLSMTLLTPVAVSCLYYGAGFAPICYDRPWLAYVLTTGLIALPRLANCLMFRWDVEMELAILAVQLPIHWICCYCYERTDSIWCPIIIHAVTNLLGSLAVLGLMVLL